MKPNKSKDCLVIMFDQVRAQRPAVYLADEWKNWLCAIGDCISALPTQNQRWAAGVIIAGDIADSMPGMPLGNAHLVVMEAVMKATGVKA